MNLSSIWDIARTCGKPRQHGKFVYFRCPCHDDREPSCSAWYGQDRILVKCFGGCSWQDLRDKLRGMGFTLAQAEYDAHQRRDLRQREVVRPPVRDADDLRRIELARKLWHEAEPAPNSPVERYLRQRGLELPCAACQSIRYHSWCPRRGERRPAMLAAQRDVVYSDILGVHRTFISDNRRDGQRMMLGQSQQTAIKLGEHEPGGKLFVAEGIETAIGAWLLGYRPVWALGSAGAVANFEPLFSVSVLTILSDHDAAGLTAARTAARRWRDAGWKCTIITPHEVGSDFADLAARRATAA